MISCSQAVLGGAITSNTESTFVDGTILGVDKGKVVSYNNNLKNYIGPLSINQAWIPFWNLYGLGFAGILVCNKPPKIVAISILPPNKDWVNIPLTNVTISYAGTYYRVDIFAYGIEGTIYGGAYLGRISYNIDS